MGSAVLIPLSHHRGRWEAFPLRLVTSCCPFACFLPVRRLASAFHDARRPMVKAVGSGPGGTNPYESGEHVLRPRAAICLLLLPHDKGYRPIR